jgi:hypothetical protein
MIIANSGFSGSTIGTRVYYTDSVEPVTGWTASTGADIDPTNVNEKLYQYITYDGVGTHYVSGIRYNYGAGEYYIYVYRSTDNGATWTVDYSFSQVGLKEIISMSTTNPSVGGIVRFVLSSFSEVVWLEHVIGNPNGIWTIRNFNTPPTAYFTGGVAIPYVYINYLNTGGVSMGNSSAFGEGALCYTTDVNSDVIKGPSPFYFYGQYPGQTFLDTYETFFPTYPGAYIDTSFYKWRTLGPGRRRRSTGPGSLRCNGGRTYSTMFAEWEFQDSNWTIEFWMYTSTANQNCTMFNTILSQIGFGAYGSFDFAITAGSLSFYSFDTAGNFLANINSVAGVPLNQWNFITAERNGGTITLYLNGVVVATASFSPTADTYFTYAANINFGAYQNGTGAYDGWLDDIRVSKNVVRYNGNFQVPWQAFPDYKPYT